MASLCHFESLSAFYRLSVSSIINGPVLITFCSYHLLLFHEQFLQSSLWCCLSSTNMDSHERNQTVHPNCLLRASFLEVDVAKEHCCTYIQLYIRDLEFLSLEEKIFNILFFRAILGFHNTLDMKYRDVSHTPCLCIDLASSISSQSGTLVTIGTSYLTHHNH